MAKGSLKNQFKSQEQSPLKKVSGSQIGAAGGAVIGSVIPVVGTAVGAAVGGVIGGLFDGGGNKQNTGPSQAEQDLEKRMKSFENYTFQTTNPYEDMQVNTQAADFQRDMQAQQQADTLQALRGAGGAAGAASLATAMSRQAAQKERAIAADIGKQEQAINLASAKQEAQNQAARQAFELDRMTTMLGIDMAEVTGQEQARLAAEQGKMNRNSQLLGAGIGMLGTLGSAFIESGGLQPKSTDSPALPKVGSITPPASLTPSINTSGMRATPNFGNRTPNISSEPYTITNISY
jgi:hypothetical protein